MDVSDSAQIFGHVRILMATIIGLGVARLLVGFAGMIQHPSRARLSAIHLVWTSSILLTLLNFWWWEFSLFSVINWSFGEYLFIIAYCVVLFMLSALVFPEDITEYRDYEDFFMSRRKWFYGFFALAVVFDVLDSALKGWNNFIIFDPENAVAIPVALILCIFCLRSSIARVLPTVASIQFLYQVSWMVRMSFNI